MSEVIKIDVSHWPVEKDSLRAEKKDDGVWFIRGKVERPKTIYSDDDDEDEKEKEEVVYVVFDTEKFKTPGDVEKWIADNAEKEDLRHVGIEEIRDAFNELELSKLVKDLDGKEI